MSFCQMIKHLKSSESLLKRAYDSGALVINEIIYSELSPQFKGKKDMDDILKLLNIKFLSINEESSFLCRPEMEGVQKNRW